MPVKVNINQGDIYGMLSIVKEDGYIYGKRAFIVKCECGNQLRIGLGQLRSGHTKSCGCIRKQKPNRKIHGESKSRLYKIWNNMIHRCYRKNDISYKNYGSREIKVCDEWRDSFICFKNWAVENGYSEFLSIERKDVNKNYSPSNCCWIKFSNQNNNKRNTVYIEFNKEIHTLKEWSAILELPVYILKNRLRSGWTLEKTFTSPIDKRYSKSKK